MPEEAGKADNIRDIKRVIKRTKRGSRAAGSTLLLNLVTEKEPQVRKLIRKCFVKMQHLLPKLEELLKAMGKEVSDLIESFKAMKVSLELPAHLKGVSRNICLGEVIYLRLAGRPGFVSVCFLLCLFVFRLGDNDLGDSGVKLVSAALRNPDCKIQTLRLQRVGLTDSGAEDLASVLSTNHTVTWLDLCGNKLGDSGVKLVSAALRHPDCKIQTLRLDSVGLTDSGAEDLVSAISTNHTVTWLDISGNKLGNSGVKLVSAALSNPDCKIHTLGLQRVGLTDSGAEDLVSALSTNHTVTWLDLSGNKRGNSGVKLVSAALRHPHCKIQRLGLQRVGLTDSGAEDLVSALSTNHTVTWLDLSGNKLGNSGVKLVSAALWNPDCKIQRLWLQRVGLTDSGVEDLVSALSTNHTVTWLDLSGNKLGNSGVKLVSAALRHPDCKIQILGLQRVGLTDSGAEDLVSALSTNHTVTWLDLSGNKLGNSGVKLVSAALRNTDCKIQRLGLGSVGLTDSGAEDLVSTLSTKPSLTKLYLTHNSLTDRCVPALRRLILNLPSLELIGLRVNKFSATGKKELRSLQESRPGLRVDV
ncbi:ribonuclease inhibitor-like [Amblyraja radiata]|uniref:ribonuclease inhibitor-like n=1 Tax=Amblyraja radiata TaxID=386614 RepID=UPI0014035A52|nr:ribonuclease inhibitor-like [Amblyraja radiata]